MDANSHLDCNYDDGPFIYEDFKMPAKAMISLPSWLDVDKKLSITQDGVKHKQNK